jgi:hypothetical protein
MQDISNYEKIRQDAENFYKKIGCLRCPALNNEYVFFTSEGFNHLMYKGSRKERSRNDQITKFKLLPKARYIIETSTTFQEYDETLTSIRRKMHKRVVDDSAVAKYWGFVAIIKDIRTKVIVRQIENGQKHFWSVIPSWAIYQYRDIKMINKSEGNLKED